MPKRMGLVMNIGPPRATLPSPIDSISSHSEDFPFSDHSTFVLYLEPIYNSYLLTYQNIITLDCVPNGPLAAMVALIHFPKLSEFQSSLVTFQGQSCVPTLLRQPVSKIGNPFKTTNAFMGSDDIPSVFSYLRSHGYQVDTSLLLSNQVLIGGVSDTRYSGNRKMIAMVSLHNS
jgi:hypothetical protein